MESKKSTIHQLEKTGAISGILSIIFYLTAIVPDLLPDSLAILMAFSFPLLWIISFMGLYRFLRKESHTPSLEIAYLFGVIGATIALSFLVVQQANFIWHEMSLEATDSEDMKALFIASFRGADRVQLSLDVVFDIFITISWGLFGLNIAKHPSFNKILGWSCSLIAFGVLAFNLYTFPTPPANAGLIDLGPFLGLWAFVFFIWFTVVLYKKKISIN